MSKVAALLGWDFHDWQQHAADVAGEYDALTRTPSYGVVGIAVARQNGKTTLVTTRIAMQLIVPKATVVYTAQDRNLARFKWQEHCDLLMTTPFADRVADYCKVNGRECLYMTNGARYLIVTPGAKSGRSMSVDLGVVDEAFAHESLAVVGALQGAMSARPHAQLWVLSNAGTARSGLWRHYTDLGRQSIDVPTSRLCWLEWAADDSSGVDVHSRAAWEQANPTLDLPHGVSSVQLAGNADTQDVSTFAREHLNIWPDLSLTMGIDPLTWAACSDPDAVPGDGLVLSLDISPERDRGAVVVAGIVDARVVLDVIETSADVHQLARTAVEVAARWNATVVLDRANPASTLLPLFERADVRVRLLSLPDFVRACGDFHDAVVHHTLTHRGDYRLTDSVAAATKRAVGDGWVWRRRGAGDVSPLIAATLARWGLVAADVELVPVIW